MIVIFFAFLLLYPSSGVGAEEAPPRKIIYSFSQDLQGAEAVRDIKGQVFRGKWVQDRIRFEGLSATANIFVNETVLVGGKARPAISFQVLARFESRLTFPKVPAGGWLRIFYAMPDSAFLKKEVTPVEFEVWMGKKKLYQTRIDAKGWKEKKIPLTLSSLLGRKYRITFKVRTVGNEWRDFLFYGYIE